MSGWIFWCFFIAPISFFYFLYWGLVHLQRASDQVAYKETSSYRTNVRRVQASAMIFVISAGILYFNIEAVDPPPTPQPTAEKNVLTESTAQVMAKTLCEMRVKDSLKSPSTADFPFFSQATFDGNRQATLSSYVDAQNGFGAMIRTNFVCTVEYSGGDIGAFESWKIVDFIVLQ
jgi:hypothetical protein